MLDVNLIRMSMSTIANQIFDYILCLHENQISVLSNFPLNNYVIVGKNLTFQKCLNFNLRECGKGTTDVILHSCFE